MGFYGEGLVLELFSGFCLSFLFLFVYPLCVTLLVSVCEWLSFGLPVLEFSNLITLPVLHPYGSGHSFIVMN